MAFGNKQHGERLGLSAGGQSYYTAVPLAHADTFQASSPSTRRLRSLSLVLLVVASCLVLVTAASWFSAKGARTQLVIPSNVLPREPAAVDEEDGNDMQIVTTTFDPDFEPDAPEVDPPSFVPDATMDADQMGSELGEDLGREMGEELGRDIGRRLGEEIGEQIGREIGEEIGREIEAQLDAQMDLYFRDDELLERGRGAARRQAHNAQRVKDFLGNVAASSRKALGKVFNSSLAKTSAALGAIGLGSHAGPRQP